MDSRTTMLFKRIQSDGISLKDIIKKIKENEYSKSKGPLKEGQKENRVSSGRWRKM